MVCYNFTSTQYKIEDVNVYVNNVQLVGYVWVPQNWQVHFYNIHTCLSVYVCTQRGCGDTSLSPAFLEWARLTTEYRHVFVKLASCHATAQYYQMCL